MAFGEGPDRPSSAVFNRGAFASTVETRQVGRCRQVPQLNYLVGKVGLSVRTERNETQQVAPFDQYFEANTPIIPKE